MSSELVRRLPLVAFDDTLVRDKMVLIAGPRQAGKTTLARGWLARHGCQDVYFNWDDAAVRRAWRQDAHFFEPAARRTRKRNKRGQRPWIGIDEIHKATRWRDILKGWYDVFHEDFRFVVTGSARLDLFRRGGDSLVGRYLLFHLFPASLNELLGTKTAVSPPAWLHGDQPPSWRLRPGADEAFALLLERGPFPEPLLSDSDRFRRRWRQDYLALLVRQDLRDLTRIVRVDRVEALVEILPGTVGSLISYSALGQDLEVAHTTVRQWLEALRRLYLLIRVRPFAHRVRRALRRAPKWYFLPAGPGRFECLIASSLHQACKTWSDAGYGRYELRYVRTLDKREIDFVILADDEPVCAIEVKESDTTPSATLRRRREYLGLDLPGIQIVATSGIARRAEPGLWIVSADRFLSHFH